MAGMPRGETGTGFLLTSGKSAADIIAQRPSGPAAQRPYLRRLSKVPRAREADPVGRARIDRRERPSRSLSSGPRRPSWRRALGAAVVLAFSALAGAFVPAAPAQAQTTVWSATLTVDVSSIYSGCSNSGGFYDSLDDCSTMTVLTDDDFDYAGTTYTIQSITAGDSGFADNLSLKFAGVTPANAKTALGSLTLHVGSGTYAISAASTDNSIRGLYWSNQLEWSDGDTLALKLTAPDTTAPTVVAASTGYYSSATLATALTGTQSAGTDIYTKVTFSEDMKQVASNTATARPQLYYRIGTTDTQYDILASGGTLASGDCKPNHATETGEYICRYTVAGSDSGAFRVKAGTGSEDKAGNALASAYTHTASLMLGASTPTTAPVGQTVAADWSLIPKDTNNNPLFTAGGKFRLLFVTSTRTTAVSSDIATYNTFVQNAANGNTALRPFKSQFRALISTPTVDARDNTATTGTGVPIYWVQGAKVADNYADFYDGSWDSQAGKTETGGTLSSSTFPYTGSDSDGTKTAINMVGSAGTTGVRIGAIGSGTAAPLTGGGFTTNPASARRPLYALSPVLTVASSTDTTRPTVTAASTGYFAEAALTTALTGPLKSGVSIYTKVTFSEDMKQVKSDGAAARPALYHRIRTTDTQYDVLAPGDTLASGDCKPNHATRTNVYVCLYVVDTADYGPFAVRVHTDSVDRANNALASTYTHATTVALDTFDPSIAFPTAGPRVGSASTITLVDSHRPATGKVAKYGAIAVDAAATDASGCDTAAKVGNANLTTLATPASPVSFRYTPPSGSAGKKVCAYVEDTAGNSHAALWTTAIVAATTPPAGAIWFATLTVDQSGVTYGCDNTDAGQDNCSSATVLTDDDFVHGGTTYTVSRVYWSPRNNKLILDFSGVTAQAAKTALGALTLTVDGTALPVSGSAAGSTLIGMQWSYDPDPDWTDGQTISLWLTAAAAAPAAPTGLTAAKDGAGAIDLSWTAPATASGRAAVTGYEIEWSADGNSGWTDLVIVSPASTTTYKDSGLAASTTRHYRVRATSSAGAGAWSSTASATTDASAAAAPSITNVALTSDPGADGFYTNGEVVEITFTFSEPVFVTGMPQVWLHFRGYVKAVGGIRVFNTQADLARGSGTNKLVFAYTYSGFTYDPAGGFPTIRVAAHHPRDSQPKFDLRGGTIRDSDGNDADLEHEGLVYPPSVSVFKTTPVPEGVKLTWEDPEDGTVTGWEYRQARAGVRGPWTTIPGGADTRAHTVTGLGAGIRYSFQVRPVRGAAKGEPLLGSEGSLWQSAVPLAAPPPAGLTVPWDWAHLPVGPDGGPRFKDGDSFRLLFVTVGERDAASSNIGEYNDFVQAEAPVAGARALISTDGVDARDNTATSGTGGVPIWWLGGGKVADDYADFWDGSWDSQAGRSALGDERSSAMVWTGSFYNGRYANTRVAGAARAQWGWLARAGKAVSFGHRGAQVRLPLYGLTPVITVKGAQPAPGPKAIGVKQGQAAGSLAVSWKEVEVEGFTCDYRVEWKESCTGEEARCAWSAERRIAVPGLGPNKATIGELTPGTSYDVRVRRSGGSSYAPWFPVGEKTFALPAAQQAPAVPAPVLESARVNGAELALRFDAVLDESSAPAGSAFAVSVAGAARTVSAVSVSQETATLTLASAVTSGEAVTVGYTPPSGARLRRAGGGDVAAFSGQAVINDTPQPQLRAALTASVSSAPSEHQGTGRFVVRIAFSESVTAKAKDAGVEVSGGTLARAVRVKKRKDLWELRIEPAGNGAVTVTLPATTDCGAAGAVCTADGRKLATALTHTVPGPATLSVADARAKEGEDATIDFAVTLSRAASGEVTVRYVTKNGSAKAGRDYTKAKGRLTFAAGETAKTVSVAVLDDAKDEGEETFRLLLKSATGAIIADGEATGTIENDDPMPAAWLARFGRTVAGQAVDAVTGRLEGGGGSHLTLGGQQVSLDSPEGQAQAAAELEAVAAALGADAPGDGFDRERWMRGGDTDERAGSSSYTMTGRELLLGSAFHLQSGGEAGGPGFAAWGRVAHGSFDGAEDGVTMDGEITTGFLGADVAGERWLAGAAVARSQGEGTFGLTGTAESAFDKGEIETTLTSVLPYARLDLSERVTAWGMLGYGTGELVLTEKGGTQSERHEADLSMTLGALGGRGTLVPAPEGGGFALALKTDAFWVRTESDATEGMEGAKADATRLRLTLDASRPFALGAGTLTPSLEAGLRHDGGDAETGAGVELGAGLGWTDPASGVTMEARGRWLAAHEASGYEEWGASGSVRIDPGASGRGLSLTLAPTVGNASSGTGTLWSAADARGIAPGTEFEAARRFDAELGYGLAGPFRLGTATPYAGLGLADGGARAWRAGVRWRLAPEVSLDLEGTRSESAGNAPEQGVMLRGAVRW